MSISVLQKYLPENSLPFLKDWISDYPIHIHISKERHGKLGDYRRLPDKSHKITVNNTLESPLFFFVLTHELAHLIAFEKFGRRILPHGNEWKITFRNMLHESISVYPEDLKPIILKFSKSPKANFMASPDLVKYFHRNENDGLHFVEQLEIGTQFFYRKNQYKIEQRLKKHYLCQNLNNGKKYLFKAEARVLKME